MKISAWAVRNPIPPLVLFLVLSLLGWIGFQNLPVNANPSVEFPLIIVTVAEPGAAPADLEVSTTRKVEGAVAGLAGVRNVMSTVSDGVSQTMVEFRIGTDTADALDRVRDAVTGIRSDLPARGEEPIVQKIDTAGGAISAYAVLAPGLDEGALSWYIDDTVIRELLTVPGVQQVNRLGGASREIRVALDPDRLEALNLTAPEVNAAIRSAQADLPGGRATIGGSEQLIRTLGEAESLDALADRRLAIQGHSSLRLGDVATIRDTVQEPRGRARLGGQSVVAFEILRAKGASDTVVADGVAAKLQEIAAESPGIRFEEVFTTVEDTRNSYRTTMTTLIEGALLTILVVFLFLRDWRATLIAAVTLPLSILPTFAVMDLAGYTLNSVTLLGLTLVVGILVDDAIVEIENIERAIARGVPPYEAAQIAADEIGLAVIAISATIVAVFLPVSFVGGIVGEWFGQFGTTISAAVISSLLVARLLTPLIAAWFLTDHAAHRAEGEEGWVSRRYRRVLDWSLRRRWLTLLIAIGLFVGSLWLSTLLPTGFVPASDGDQVSINLESPPGSTLATTDRLAGRLAEEIARDPDVTRVFYAVGSGENVTTAVLRVKLRPRGIRSGTQREVAARLRLLAAPIPDVRISVAGEWGGRDVTQTLTGSEPETLRRAAETLAAEMRGLDVVANVTVAAPLPRTELRIIPDQDRAAELGVAAETLAGLVLIATLGDVESQLARYSLADRQVPVRVMLEDSARGDPQVLAGLRVPTAAGTTVPLEAVARLEYGAGEAEITRRNQRREVSVEADLAPGRTLGEALAEITTLPAYSKLPDGVKLAPSGDGEAMAEVFSQFGAAMLVGVMMVLAVLILLYRDFLQPLTILVSLPFSVGGAVGGLLIADLAFDLPAMIGVLMLMGVVTKNAILLVDVAIEQIAHGVPRREALINACALRARPIVMTSVAMIAGMVPLALGIHGDNSFSAPMAVAVMGGLATSTLLSLLFVPAMFTFFADLGSFLGRQLLKLTVHGRVLREARQAAADPEPAPAPLVAEVARRPAEPAVIPLAAE